MDDPDTNEIDLHAILGVIRRQSKIIIYTVAAILVMTLAYLFAVTPKYTAVAMIATEPNRDVLTESTDALGNANAMSATVDGAAEIIKSNDVLLSLIQSEGLLRDDEFGVSLSRLDRLRNLLGLAVEERQGDGVDELYATLKRVRDAVTVTRKGRTYLMEISVTSASAEKAARLANALASDYITYQIQNKVDRTTTARDILSRQVEAAKVDLQGIEGKVDGFLSDFIDDFVSQTGRDDLRALQIDLEAQSAVLERERARLAALSAAASGKAWDSLSVDLAGDATRELLIQRRELNAKLQDAEPGGIDAANLREELAALEAKLANATTEDLRLTRVTVNQYQTSRDDLQDELRTSVLNSDLPAGALTDLYQLQQEGNIARAQYEDLLRRLRQLDTLASLQIADSSIVSKALIGTLSFPNKRLTLALALVLSAGLGMGLAFLNEFFVGGFTSDDQLRDVLNAADAINVPAISDEAEDVARAVIEAPLSSFSESYRQLKKIVDKSLRKRPGGQGRVIVLTSAVPAEGKSVSSLSLARTYAASGLKTILVDLDLRKPALGARLGIDADNALLRYLTQDGVSLADLPEKAHQEGENLVVLPGGGRPDVPTDSLMDSQRMKTLINGLREQFDIVILDTAPVLPVVDTLYLVSQADVALQIVRFASTNQRDVRRAYNRITQEVGDGVEVIPVLTMEQQRRGAYYYRGYYSGYGYTKRNY